MTATFDGVKRRIVYKKGYNNAWLQLPRFWVGYVMALWSDTAPGRVAIKMDEQGILTITPIKEDKHANTKQEVTYSPSKIAARGSGDTGEAHNRS